jgi:putative transposase
MKRKRHTPQEIIAKLREAEVDLNQGATIEAVCRKLEISEQTFHCWRHLYGGMTGPEMARMKELEKENARLKKIVAQQAMDIAISTLPTFLDTICFTLVLRIRPGGPSGRVR